MLTQLALVPILIFYWGADKYGTWLTISAIPAYLTLSDFGFTFVAKNEMVMQVASNRRDDACVTFQSIYVLLLIVSPLLLGTAVGALWLTDFDISGPSGDVSMQDAKVAASLLMINVVLYQFALLVSAGIRSENRPATETAWATGSRLMDGIATIVTVAMGGSIVAVAAVSVLNRIAFNIAAYCWMRKHTNWLWLGYSKSRKSEVHRLLRPALSYMLMPISQALLIQGPILVLGFLGPPINVVIFSTSRTLARLGTAATNVLNNTFVTEYAARAGSGDQAAFHALLRLHIMISGFAVAFYSLTILIASPILMDAFTHGKVIVTYPFYLVLVLAVAAEMIWSALFTPISAVNHHRPVATWLVFLSTAALLICWALSKNLGPTGAALALLLANSAMIAVCVLVGRSGFFISNSGAQRPAIKNSPSDQ